MSIAERDELLGGIRSSADRLRLLAADLASAARSVYDTLPQRLERVSLTETLRSAAARARAAGAGIKIVTEVVREGEFSADPGRLAQALDNLLDNALRHGTPPICLAGTVDDDVRIRVTDAGSGIPPVLVPHLFERFAVTGPSGGTGLGLHLVREIARRHGGEVTYRAPANDRPTTFELTLPRWHHGRR